MLRTENAVTRATAEGVIGVASQRERGPVGPEADRSIGRCCCHYAAAVDDRRPRDPRSEVADEHRSPRAQDHSRAPSDGARAAEARAPRLLTAAVARGRSSPHGGRIREPRHPAGGDGRRPGGLGRARRRLLARGRAPHAVGTALVAAVMITAILKVHVSNGIWAAEGGFEFPLVLVTVGFAITTLGPGSLSVDSWLAIDNWAGINWTINPAARSAIALAVGLAGGLVVALASRASKRTPTHASPQAAR